MSKNTPGPWSLNPEKDDHDIPVIRVSGADGSSFAFIYENSRTGQLNVDDARLIAAAPELLSACKASLSAISSLSRAFATGYGPEDEAAYVRSAIDQIHEAINKATKEKA